MSSKLLSSAGLPRCPEHLDPVARKEWRRLARPLFDAGILTVADRAAFAAYCQCYSHWAEAVRRQHETPPLIRTPGGHVRPSPWIGIANRQLDLMGRFMAELGITPTARARLPEVAATASTAPVEIHVIGVLPDDDRGAATPPPGLDRAPGRVHRDVEDLDL